VTFPPGTDEEYIEVNLPDDDWSYEIIVDDDGYVIVVITPPAEENGGGEPNPQQPTLTKSASATQVSLNGTITYTLTVVNPSDTDVSDFVVVDDLSALPVTFNRASLRVNGETVSDSDMSFIDRVLRVYLQTIPAEGYATVTFTVTVNSRPSNGIVRNTALLLGPAEEDGERPQSGESASVSVSVRQSTPPGGNPGVDTNPLPNPNPNPDTDTESDGITDYPWRQAFLIGRQDGYYQPRTSNPQSNITRAEVATIFFRLIADQTRTNYWAQTNPFVDIELENWFNNAVSTTANMGIFRGVSDYEFAPNQSITRAELAVVLVRFMGMEHSSMIAATQNNGDRFNDIDNHWARAYINEAARHGWIEGEQGLGGPFNPSRPITRAEAAAMINRIFQRLIESPDYLLPNMVTFPDNRNPNSWYYLHIYMATNSYTYRWREDRDPYKELIEIIQPRDWSVLELPTSRPGDILR